MHDRVWSELGMHSCAASETSSKVYTLPLLILLLQSRKKSGGREHLMSLPPSQGSADKG